MDAVTAETTGEDWDLILNINQGIHKLDEKWSLMSTFQARLSKPIVENAAVQNDSSSRLVLV